MKNEIVVKLNGFSPSTPELLAIRKQSGSERLKRLESDLAENDRSHAGRLADSQGNAARR
jgi:hypothetical protein